MNISLNFNQDRIGSRLQMPAARTGGPGTRLLRVRAICPARGLARAGKVRGPHPTLLSRDSHQLLFLRGFSLGVQQGFLLQNYFFFGKKMSSIRSFENRKCMLGAQVWNEGPSCGELAGDWPVLPKPPRPASVGELRRTSSCPYLSGESDI